MDSSWSRLMWSTAAPEATGRVMRSSDMRSSARIPPPSSAERWVVGHPLKWCWTELWSFPSWSARDSLTRRTSLQKSKSWKRAIRSRRSTTAKPQDALFCRRLHRDKEEVGSQRSSKKCSMSEPSHRCHENAFVNSSATVECRWISAISRAWIYLPSSHFRSR